MEDYPGDEEVSNVKIDDLLWFLTEDEERIRHDLHSELSFGDYEVGFVEELENPENIVPSERAEHLMNKLRKWEAVRLPRMLKKINRQPFTQRCAQASSLSVRDGRVYKPGPWLKCPLMHDLGDDYTANPFPPKKVFNLKKAFSLRRTLLKQREKKLLGCKFCCETTFTHHKDTDLYYQDYLDQVTCINHPKEDSMEQGEYQYYPHSGHGFIPKNSLLEYDMPFMPICLPIRTHTAAGEHYDLSPGVREELKYMLDPRHCDSPFEDLPSAVTGVSKRILRSKRITLKKSNPPLKPLGSGRGIIFPGIKSYADVKSRYMLPLKRLEQLKAPTEPEVETPRNPFPMPDDAIYNLPPTPSFMRKVKPVYQQLQPKEAQLVLKTQTGRKDSFQTEPKPPIRLTGKPKLSARMEFLSQPKPRKTRASLYQRSLRFRTADNSRTLPRSKPTTPRVVVGRNTSSLTQGSKKKKLAVKKLAGKKKLQRKVKHVLSAFGFDFDIPPKLSESKMHKGGSKAKPEKKNPPTETQRDKYRMSVLKMLEKASIRSKKKKEMERIEQLERGIAAMAIEAAAAVSAAEKNHSVIFR